MPERDQWSPADDESIRGALDTLRWETETVPLADVRFVKARGNARHRRAQLVGSMSVAAAAVALGFIGFHSLGSNQSLDVGPAATSSTSAPTSSPSAHPTVAIAAPGPLLVAAEWQRALGYTETVKLGEMRSGEGVDTCVSAPGTQIAIGYAVLANPHGYGDLYGVQGTYRAGSSEAGNTAAAKAASQIDGCREGPASAYKAEADAAWPKVFKRAANQKSAPGVWFIVAHQGALTSLLSVGDPTALHPVTDAGFSLAQIQALALFAQQRLIQLDEGAGSSEPTSTAPGRAQTPGQGDLPVAGPRPLLSSDLFVAPSKWSSPGLSVGHATKAMTTEWEGSASIFWCDADLALDMTPGAGRFGIVAVADQVTGTYLGKQRIRLVASAAAAKAEVERLLTAIKACPTTNANAKASVTQSPTNAGQFKIVTGLGTAQQVVEWVAVSANEGTPEAVSTVSLFGRPGLVDGFAELDALIALAVQK